jgi:short-subunit dehydrogenase
MRTLTGRHVLITGAAGGLGPVIAAAFAAHGARLSLAARPEDTVPVPAGAQANAFPGDLLVAETPEQLVASAEAAFGPVDVLVNNAGVEHLGALQDAAVEHLVAAVRLNLEIPMRLARAVLPGMLAQRRGHVVNMASLAGKGPTPFGTAYGATKHGMVGFTRALRAELHGTGVSASAVCPGFVGDRGMYARVSGPTGIRAPGVVRTTTSAAVAAAVLRAIQHDLPELIVNPGPMRLMAALGELFPSFGGWLVRAGGVTDVQRRWAAHAARTGATA